MSGIQRIGYHFLYNVGVKIERDKSKTSQKTIKIKGTARTTKGKTIMKKTTAPSIDFANNTIILTKAYAKLAYTPNTKEFRELSAILKAYPHLTVAMRTASKNENKEKFTDLSVSRMERFIKCFKDEKALKEFYNAKDFYTGTAGYYGKMKKWFLDKYKEEYLNADFSKMAEDKEPEAQAPASEATAN